MAFRVVLDARVSAPYELSGVLLALAEHELFTPLWSRDILDETERTLVTKLGVPALKARKRIAAMSAAFPSATIDNYAELVKGLRCHKKDRHVLAAAVRGNAELIVTVNLKDFPDAAVEPFDIEIVHPDRFLMDQRDLDAERTLAAIEQMVSDYEAPPLTVLELMRRLRAAVPNFAQQVGTKIILGEPIERQARCSYRLWRLKRSARSMRTTTMPM